MEVDDSDKKPSKVKIIEDIQLGPATHLTIIRPDGAIIIPAEVKEGKKINILQRRKKNVKTGQTLDVSMAGPSQIQPIHHPSTHQLLPKHTEKNNELLQDTQALPPSTDQTVNDLLKDNQGQPSNTRPTVIASGTFTNILNIKSPNKKQPKEPRVPIIMKRPQLEHGVRPQDVKIFSKYTGPEWYTHNNDMLTDPIQTDNLPKVFHDFPLFGIPKNTADLPHFQDQLVQDFVGVSDDEYENLKAICSPNMLFTNNEIRMLAPRPSMGTHSASALRAEEHVVVPANNKLEILKKLNTRVKLDINNLFSRKLKYRGVRLLSLQNQEKRPEPATRPPDLAPGHDLLFRVRLYRPFTFAKPGVRRRAGASDGQEFRGRHSVFHCDVVLLGRQPLTALRERIVCRNDLDLRLDMSEHPDLIAPANSKDSFPSNFLFINNVFYVDTRTNCKDLTREVREFAKERGLGDYEVRDMCSTTLAEIRVRLAYAEVYVHQGDCEHLFQFSEIRLLSYADPLHLSNYPCNTAASQNQTLYCSTCAEFAAKWIVTGTESVPFDPAFFCETCFYSYMYIDRVKVDNFKAYLYKGNEMSALRPNMDSGEDVAMSVQPMEVIQLDY